MKAALREPGFSQAWAGLADIAQSRYWRTRLTPAEEGSKARAAAQRWAIELDPDAVEGHYVLEGQIYMDQDRTSSRLARSSSTCAMKLDDRSARLWHHRGDVACDGTGQVEQAFAAIRRARGWSPTLLYARTAAGCCCTRQRYDVVLNFWTLVEASRYEFDQARVQHA